MQLALSDSSAPEEMQPLFSSDIGQDPDSDRAGNLTVSGSLGIGGRTWDASIFTLQQSVFSVWQPWSALLAGLSLTSVAFAYLLLAMQRESRTKHLVEQRTIELSQSNQQLANEILDRSRIQQELAGLYEITSIFSAEGDFQTKATNALEKVSVLTSADWVTLRLPGPRETVLNLVAASGPAVKESPPLPVFTEAMTMSTRAFTEGIIEVIDDYAARPKASQSLVDLGMQSMVLQPIKANERTLGLVTVISKDKDHFSPALVYLLTSVGEGLGVLLENSLLQQESDKAHQAQLDLADENVVIAEIGRILGSSLNISEGFEMFALKTHSLVTFDQLDITVIDPSGEYDEVAFSTASDGGFPGPTSMQGSITQRVTSDLTGLIVQDLPASAIATDFSCLVSSANDGQRPLLIVPLIHNGVGIGALFLSSGKESAFTEDDLNLITRLGHMIAGAISNASHHARQIKAEEALREREARLHGIVESAVDGIVTIDEVGIVASFNHGAETIFGYSSNEVVGQNVKMLMPMPHHAAHDGYLNAYKRTGVKKIIGAGREVAGLRKDGTVFPLDLSVSVVELADRTIYTGIIRDITKSHALQREIGQRAKELEIAYSELQTLDRMKDEFIATVSHELRTPLTSTKGAAEILLNYQDEDRATQTEFLSIIDNESDRLTRLINDVLDLARMESGETVWDISTIDLQSVIETAMYCTHALILNKDVTVEIAADHELPAVEADSDKLVQVVTNLLSNAIKFTPNGGSIRSESRLVPDESAITGVRMVEVSIADTGIGIPSGDVHKIFGRFQQAGTTLANRPQGIGLGLAISKEIITHLGGEIWVESEIGEGSTFFFTVPSVPTPAG